MLSTRNILSQWTLQRLSLTQTRIATTMQTTSSSRFVSDSMHNALYLTTSRSSLLCRNYSTRYITERQLKTTYTQYVSDLIKRWKIIIARLYARRVLDTAMAAALLAKQKATLLERGYVHKPTDWQNWERKDWTEELLASLGGTKRQRAWASFKRLMALSFLASPLVILYPVSLVSNKVKDWTWSYALWGIEQAGPTFIKLTQWATTRHDLFSPAFCAYFGQLRDHTKGHSWQDTVKILEQDLGAVVAHEYIDIDRTSSNDNIMPIGSGCIAQVYKGRLLKPIDQYPAGTEIAIKVQHPGIWHKVCVDFYIMAKVARWLESLPKLSLKYLALSDTVRQFRDIMLPQLDLTLEAKHLQRFNRDFSGEDQVDFPKPLVSLTTPRVLTETFIKGTPILEYLKAPESVRKELAYLGLNTTLKMIFLNDFLHGDLHPGNIMIGKTPSGKLKYLLLDCGLVVEMGPEQHVNLVKILGAFTRRKGRLAGQLMVDTSSDCQASPLDVEMFVSGISRIVEDDEDMNFVEKVGDYIADIMFLACKHKVKLEASFVNAALSIEIIEGIASALYPPIVVTKEALPLVLKAEMMHRLPKISLW